MSKKVELVHAEVISQYNSNEVLKEFNTEKGTLFSWSVKTKVNDKADKSPVIFDSCTLFAGTEDQKEYVRANIKEGAILDLKGYADRRKGNKPGKDGKIPYFDQVSVKEIVPITGVEPESSSVPSDDNLPF